MITGKNKEQFEKWYNNLALFQDIKNGILPSHYELFKSYPFEMQIGVYLAYYDSLGYDLDVFRFNGKKYSVSLVDWRSGFMDGLFSGDYNTRNEAYKEAFKKADELINNK